MQINIGDIVKDNHDRIGIVVEEIDAPSPDWLSIQSDARISEISNSRWWRVLVFQGGSASVPEDLAVRLRKGTIEDALKLVSDAHVYRKKSLTDSLTPAFPELPRMVE